MKRKRHTPEQIVRKLREDDRTRNDGTDVLRHLEVSESSWARWRAQYDFSCGATKGRNCRLSLRCDNGPELIAWALRDWCRMSRIGINYIEPDSPWENADVESFNGRVRDEQLNIEEFGSLLAWTTEHQPALSCELDHQTGSRHGHPDCERTAESGVGTYDSGFICRPTGH